VDQKGAVYVLLNDVGALLAISASAYKRPDFRHVLRHADSNSSIRVLAGLDDPRVEGDGPLFFDFLDFIVIQLKGIILVVRVYTCIFMFFGVFIVIFSFDIFHILVDLNFLPLRVLFYLPID